MQKAYWQKAYWRKAYWIAHVTVTDAESYAEYQNLAPEAFAKFNAQFLAQGGTALCYEGTPYDRHVVIEFNSLADAKACYNSPEYQNAKIHRDGACSVHITIVEGV